MMTFYYFAGTLSTERSVEIGAGSYTTYCYAPFSSGAIKAGIAAVSYTTIYRIPPFTPFPLFELPLLPLLKPTKPPAMPPKPPAATLAVLRVMGIQTEVTAV